MKIRCLHIREAGVGKKTQALNAEKSLSYFHLLQISCDLRRDLGFICYQVKKVMVLGKAWGVCQMENYTGNPGLTTHWVHSPLASGNPWWLSGKESACQYKRHRFDPWVGKITWRRKCQPILVSLPGKFHGQRSLLGYSLWSCKESDTARQLSTHTKKRRENQSFPHWNEFPECENQNRAHNKGVRIFSLNLWISARKVQVSVFTPCPSCLILNTPEVISPQDNYTPSLREESFCV